MKSHNDDLEILLQELQLDEDRARQVRRDLTAGDALLERQGEVPLPPGLLQRIEKNVLQSERHVVRYPWWLMRVAAVITLAFVGVMIFQRSDDAIDSGVREHVAAGDRSISGIVLENELVAWEVALTLEDDMDYGNNDVTLSEMIDLWEQAGWETDNLLEKEPYDEKDNLGVLPDTDDTVA